MTKRCVRQVVVLVSLLVIAAGCTEVRQASVNSAGEPGDAVTTRLSVDLSFDGRYVVFASKATNLGNNPTGQSQIWRHDLQTATTDLVSVAFDCVNDPCPAASGDSFDPVISADGRYVAFSSWANDFLAPGVDNNFLRDIYRADMTTGEIAAVSVNAHGSFTSTRSPVMSDDGNHIAFEGGPQLGGGPSTHDLHDVYLRVMEPYSMTRVGLGADGQESPHGSFEAFISADGQAVIFRTEPASITSRNRVKWDQGTISAVTLPMHPSDQYCLADNSRWYVSDFSADLTRVIYFTDCAGYQDGVSLIGDMTTQTAQIVVPCGGPSLLSLNAAGTHALGNQCASERGVFTADLAAGTETMMTDLNDRLQFARGSSAKISGDGLIAAWLDSELQVQVGFAQKPTITSITSSGVITAGATVSIDLSGSALHGDINLTATGSATIDGEVVTNTESMTATVTVPADTAPGAYDIVIDLRRPDLGGLKTFNLCQGCLVVE